MKHILLFGKDGQVGYELQRALPASVRITAFGSSEVNLCDEVQLRAAVRAAQPDVILNAAAYNAVDRAETDQATAMAVNARAPGVLAEEAYQLGAWLVQYSTDYVFDGAKGRPYVETDRVAPLNVYGRSKLAGEQRIQEVGGRYLILRTSWVYSTRRDSFLNKVLDWAQRYPVLRIVEDQVGSPTWCRMLAETTRALLAVCTVGPASVTEGFAGVYHVAGTGSASRYAWAREIVRLDAARRGVTPPEVVPVTSDAFPLPAVRPAFSGLDCSRVQEVFGLSLSDWRHNLRRALVEEPAGSVS